VRVKDFLSPRRGWISVSINPRLAPWAAFFRRFAAAGARDENKAADRDPVLNNPVLNNSVSNNPVLNDISYVLGTIGWGYAHIR
jgi:hypothetical protein